MSLDSFLGLDAGEGMSEGALEQLRERMKAAAAQIAAIKKEEKKQKKKEQELLKILLQFVQRSQKKDLVLLLSRCLEQDIPANFLLAIILLSNKEIREQMGGASGFMALEPGQGTTDQVLLGGEESHVPDPEDKALIFFSEEDESLPLKIKIELDAWIKSLLFQAEEAPQKLLKKAYKIEIIKHKTDSYFDDPRIEEKKYIQPPLIRLTAHVVRDFLEQNNMSEPIEKLESFSEFILKGILQKTKDAVENRKELSGDVAEDV